MGKERQRSKKMHDRAEVQQRGLESSEANGLTELSSRPACHPSNIRPQRGDPCPWIISMLHHTNRILLSKVFRVQGIAKRRGTDCQTHPVIHETISTLIYRSKLLSYICASIYSSRLVAKFINSILIVVRRCSIDEITKNFVQRLVHA